MIRGVLLITHDLQYKMNPERVEWFCIMRLLKKEGIKVFIISPYSMTNFEKEKWETFKNAIDKEADGYYLFPKKKSISKFLNPFIPYVAIKNKPSLSEKESIIAFINSIRSNFDLIIQDHIYSYEITRIVIEIFPNVLRILRTVNIEKDFFLHHSKKYSIFDYKKYMFILDGLRMSFYEPMVIKKMNAVLFLSTAELKKMKKRIKNIPFLFFPYIYSTDFNLFILNQLEENIYLELKEKFANKKIILFINNFSDRYSLKETKWFIKKVFPNILKEVPDAVFLCCGFSADKYLKKDEKNGIYIYSNLISVKPYIKLADTIVILTENKIGVKSKFIEALYFRKKIVSTKAGVYGSGLEDVFFATDNSKNFSELVISSLNNKLDFSKLFEKFEK